MAMKAPDHYRIKSGIFGSHPDDGPNGVFVWDAPNMQIRAIASNGMGWEHVSVTILFKDPKKAPRCPYWNEMCEIKNAFWDEEDCVIQYHPPKTEYVSCHDYCLHLWKPVGVILPLPPSILVGPDSSKK